MEYLLKYNNTELSFGNNIFVTNWDGAGVSDIISTTSNIGDGSTVNKAKHPERQIIINIRVFNERQKQAVYDIFTTRKNGVLTYYPYDNGAAKQIDCEVTSVKPNGSAMPTVMQIVLLCTYPFWRSVDKHVALVNGTTNALEFPLEIPYKSTLAFGYIKSGNAAIFDYGGNVATGFTANILTSTAASIIRLTNFYTNEYIEIRGNYDANSEFQICTEDGKQKILHRIAGEAEWEDITIDFAWGSTFFKIAPGTNRIFVDAYGAELSDVTVDFTLKFGGV